MYSRFAFLFLCLALLAPRASHGVECSYLYSAAMHPDPPAKKEKLLAVVRRIPKSTYNFLLRNTMDDYKAAWTEGSVAGRPYRILKRFLFAPRVRVGKLSPREIDAFYENSRGKNLAEIGRAMKGMSQKERELLAQKRIQWLSLASEPAIDGVLEVTSKLKQKYGPRLGLTSRPLKSNLSLPGGVAVNVATGFGTYAYLSDKIEGRRQEKLKAGAETSAKAGMIGAPYLAEWAEFGFLEPEERKNLLDWNAQRINEWGKNLSSSDPNRPLPPRFYQFYVEGLLEKETVSRFEDIALAALQEAQKGGGNEASSLRKLLLAKLAADPVFQKKSKAERGILAMAFEPPVFLDGSGLPALETLMKGDTAAYLNSARENADIFWMLQLAKNPRLKPVRELFEGSTTPLSLVFASLSADRDRGDEAEPWFPASQLPSLQRADYFHTLYPPATFLDANGKEVELRGEVDYLREWRGHPFFLEEMKRWEKGAPLSAAELDEMREKTNSLQLVHVLQKEAKAAGRTGDGVFPPDPSGAEACFLAENDPYLERYLKKFSLPPASKNFCRYLVTLNYWRMAHIAQRDRSTHAYGAERIAVETKNLERRYLELCADPAHQQEFAANAALSFPKLEAALSCGGAQ